MKRFITFMNEHFRQLFIGACLVMSVTSCTNLDEEVFSEITEDSFVPADEDIVALTASAYTPLRYIMGWQGLFDVQEESADIFVTPTRPNGWDDGGTYKRMHRHTWNDVQWQPRNTWLTCFNGINSANRVISQIESGSLPISEEQAASVIAELRGVRAVYYSILLDTHGNVPIIKNFSDEVPTQASRSEVYNFIISELNEVIPMLTETADQTTYGRLNKWGALALQARVYLNAEVYVGTAEWDKVISNTDQIINSGAYMLDDNYRDVFSTDNQNSPEIVFSVPYDRLYGPEWNQHMKQLLPSTRDVLNMEAQPWGGSSANPQFIDSYQDGDKRLADSWFMGEQRDADTGEVLYTLVNYMPSITGCEFYEGLRFRKYEILPGTNASLPVDFPYFRYADVLMMKAEALLRTGNADEAAMIVTEVRERSFDDPEAATVTGAELMGDSLWQYGTLAEDGSIAEPGDQSPVQYGRFLDELGWEFVGEARRRTDIIRFGVYSTKNWYNHTPQGEYTKLFPIGLEELNTNTNLTQNPGY
ncbi:MAG: RagB/SusD family nutrient uptake outer membrane protein [Christiangramia sp.]|uniref:RagB/SusD family nutrient uptake outer membrane protein n=1 Tax=Christiangramia sp. TaxID=1931228 RepID=UPI002353C2DD